MLKEITFDEIKPLWERLWVGRDDIRPMSSMLDVDDWDLSIYVKYSPTFFGVFTDDTNELIAVNSCHPTTDTHMRSRGLYVKVGYTGKGLGQSLLQHTIKYARDKGYQVIWSMPRDTAMKTYTSAGFKQTGEIFTKDSYMVSGVMQQGTNYRVELEL